MRSLFSRSTPAASDKASDAEKASASKTLPGGLTLEQLRSDLTDEQIAQQTEAVSAMLNFRGISDAEKQCAAKIVAMTLSNHTSRYYHYHRAIEARLICSYCENQIATTVEAGTAKDVEQTDGGFRRISDFTLVSDEKARGACELPFYPRRIDRALFDEMVTVKPAPVDTKPTDTVTDTSVPTVSETDLDDAIDGAMEAEIDSTDCEAAAIDADADVDANIDADIDDAIEAASGFAADDAKLAAGEKKRKDSIVSAMSKSFSSMVGVGTHKCRCEQMRKSVVKIADDDLLRGLCAANLAWSHEIACTFAKFLHVADSKLEGLVLLCEQDSLVDPRPMLAALSGLSSSPFRLPLILIHFSIGHFGYLSARMRTLVKELIGTCDIDWQTWLAHERIFGDVLRSLLSDMSGGEASSDDGGSAAAAAKRKKWKRWAKIGAAGAVGGVAIAFTGGLAAPAVAAGVATLGFTSAGALLATSGGAATVTLVFGATGAGYAGKRAYNRLGDVNEFYLKRVSRRSGLNVVIGVCGFLFEKKKKMRSLWKDEIEDGETEAEKSDADKIDGDKVDVEADKKIEDDSTAAAEPTKAKADVSEDVTEEIESKAAGDEASEEVGTDGTPPVTAKEAKERGELEKQCEDYWRKTFDRDCCDCNWRADCYSLVFETAALRNLGRALRSFAQDQMVSQTISKGYKYGLGYTAAGALLSAVAWPSTLMGIADVLDTPWGVCLAKAEDAGILLANNIDNEKHGHRPVTLIGFSMGARVIYFACRELAKRVEDTKAELRRLKRASATATTGSAGASDKSGVAASSAKAAPKKKESKDEISERTRLEARLCVLKDKIENVVLFGAPCGGNVKKWRAIRELVADRVVNCYATGDWLLKFVYRSDQIYPADIAGLSPVKCPGVDNIDLSHVVKGHTDYYDKVPELMRLLTQSGVLLF